MTIVCGTDFSVDADGSAQAAAALARSLNVPLRLVHVQPEVDPALAAAPPAPSTYPLNARLHAQSQRLSEEFGIVVEPVVVEGDAHDGLVKAAREASASLIVVGALGATKHRHWLLGSVAERVAQCAPVPVLVVRDPLSIRAWADGTRNLRVTVGTDLGVTSKVALRWATSLRRIKPCELRIAEIVWPFAEHARYGVSPPIELEGLRPELRVLLERDLREWAGTIEGTGEASFSVTANFGRVDAALTVLASETETDLLVVGTHQRSRVARTWQGSVSRGAIHRARSNVVCVPLSTFPDAEAGVASFRSVLVPTDLSLLGNRAIPFAYGLVAAGGTVHLLYVATSRDDQASLDVARQLRALIPAGLTSRAITSEVHVCHEPKAHDAIWHNASRLGVDAICMATHGRSGAVGALLGSQAREVVARARQPVLLVPPERD